MADRNKESVYVAAFKKWPFQSDFDIAAEDGKVTSVLCKYCSEMEYNAFMWEARARNIKGSALKSVENFRNAVTYIHRPTLTRHVGNNDSFHNWCKRKLVPNVSDEAGTSHVNLQPSQPTVTDSFLASNTNHYEKLFRTVLFLLEEELVFTKLQPLMKLQKNNDLGLMSLNKINHVACAEFAEIIAEVI